jgi:hypothetical protein
VWGGWKRFRGDLRRWLRGAHETWRSP